MGLALFIFDYRGYGQSKGDLTEQGTVFDALSGFEFLLSKGFDPEDIVIWGRSLGGAVAVQAASMTNPGKLIVESSFTSIPDMAARMYPFLPARLLSRYDYPSESTLKTISTPAMFIHSPQDEIIPYDMGKKLFEAAYGPKTFLEISGDHNQGFLQSIDKYEKGIASFLK